VSVGSGCAGDGSATPEDERRAESE
jgi:hypothetical protein